MRFLLANINVDIREAQYFPPSRLKSSEILLDKAYYENLTPILSTKNNNTSRVFLYDNTGFETKIHVRNYL